MAEAFFRTAIFFGLINTIMMFISSYLSDASAVIVIKEYMNINMKREDVEFFIATAIGSMFILILALTPPVTKIFYHRLASIISANNRNIDCFFYQGKNITLKIIIWCVFSILVPVSVLRGVFYIFDPNINVPSTSGMVSNVIAITGFMLWENAPNK